MRMLRLPIAAGVAPHITYDTDARAIINGRRVSVPSGFDADPATNPGRIYIPASAASQVRFSAGVYIDPNGFPDFSPYSVLNVRITRICTAIALIK